MPKRRPYRSHAIPACMRCRQRKQKCVQEAPGAPCIACSQQWLECSAAPRIQSAHFSPAQAEETPREAQSNSPGTFGQVRDNVQRDRSPSQSAYIMGPTVAHDVHSLQPYLSHDSHSEPQTRANPFNVYSDDPVDPIIYRKVRRKREGMQEGQALKYLEELERLVAPHSRALIDLYFDVIHPFYPLLDEHNFRQSCSTNSASPALLSSVYAIAIPYWTSSVKLRSFPKPDVARAWNISVKALHEACLAPGFSTLLASLIDLAGRPITSVTSNAILLGEAVSLAYTMGLNRNPAKWNMDQRSKNLRIRAWWVLLIHDRWSSVCHGTPPLIDTSYSDIGNPELETLLPVVEIADDDRREQLFKGACSFRVLCELTIILTKVLQMVYQVKQRDTKGLMDTISRIKSELQDLVPKLQPWQTPGDKFERLAPGNMSLCMSQAAIRLCLKKLYVQALRHAGHDKVPPGVRATMIEDVIDVDISLLLDVVCEANGYEVTTVFWMPYTAYHFAAFTTFALRCAIEEKDAVKAAERVERTAAVVARLRDCRDRTGWDLVDACLLQCGDVVQRMQTRMHQHISSLEQQQQQELQVQEASHSRRSESENVATLYQASVTATPNISSFQEQQQPWDWAGEHGLFSPLMADGFPDMSMDDWMQGPPGGYFGDMWYLDLGSATPI